MNPTLKHVLTLAAIPVIILVIYLGYTLFFSSGEPAPPDFTYLERQVVGPVMKMGAKSLPIKSGYHEVLSDVVADKKKATFEMLRRAVASEGKYNLVLRKDTEKKSEGTIESIRNLFQKEKERPTLLARLQTIETNENISASLEIEFTLPKMKTRTTGPYTETYRLSSWNLDYLGYSIRQTSAWMRLLIWLLVAGLLPVVTGMLIKKVVAMEKNAANALLLIGYTVFDAVLAFILMGFAPGFFGMLLLLAGTVLGFLWITVAANKIDEWRK